eukprot:gene17875-24266_t
MSTARTLTSAWDGGKINLRLLMCPSVASRQLDMSSNRTSPLAHMHGGKINLRLPMCPQRPQRAARYEQQHDQSPNAYERWQNQPQAADVVQQSPQAARYEQQRDQSSRKEEQNNHDGCAMSMVTRMMKRQQPPDVLPSSDLSDEQNTGQMK